MKRLKVMIVFVLLGAGTAASAAEFKVPPGDRPRPGDRIVVMPAAPREAAYIGPGDRVDMVVTLFTGAARGLTSMTVLQNVRVLDTVRKGEAAWLVLALTPVEAQQALLSQKFRVNFVLRSKGDEQLVPLETVSYVGLFRNYKEGPAPEREAEDGPEAKEFP